MTRVGLLFMRIGAWFIRRGKRPPADSMACLDGELLTLWGAMCGVHRMSDAEFRTAIIKSLSYDYPRLRFV